MSPESSSDRAPRTWQTLKERYQENRETDAHAPWRDWLWQRYARYWYGVGSLFLDVVVLGTVLQNGADPTQAWKYLLAVVLLPALVYLEYEGYRKLWPHKPPVL